MIGITVQKFLSDYLAGIDSVLATAIVAGFYMGIRYSIAARKRMDDLNIRILILEEKTKSLKETIADLKKT